jgi:hypothetical protein
MSHNIQIFQGTKELTPIPVPAKSMVRVYDRSLAGSGVSNPAGGMDLRRSCCVLSCRISADHSSRGVRLTVIEVPHVGGLSPLGVSSHEKRKKE